MKKVTVNGTVVLHQHYLYRGYLQIAALDLTRSNAPALWLLHWDPTQPVATRPLSLRKNGTWYTYGHDLTKNVTELYKADGTIATAYDYTPYGTVTATGIDQPIQWSSEHYDPELALVYYNYRHYNPADGRWINRDPIAEKGGRNLYAFVGNNCIRWSDWLGFVPLIPWIEEHFIQEIKNRKKTDNSYRNAIMNICVITAEGCIGVTKATLGQIHLDMSRCYAQYEEAYQKLQSMKESKECENAKNMFGGKACPRIFGIHTFEGETNNGTPRIFKQRPDKTYNVDSVIDGRHKPIKNQGEAVGRYDFCIVSIDGSTVQGADHSDGPMLVDILTRLEQEIPQHILDSVQDGAMDIYTWKREQWAGSLGKDYNREFWCVTCEQDAILNLQ
ncbi:RHS repeat domain-containing protein [Akkermansia glycaniphila]|uniref:Rhs protein signature n=1 Tax=Akkermansia glycaniphila TaxID=1679444 RepID=A0A1C7PF85_9BACT|nr:RHS repeat-associated core domain-containing protein [Akkermansia glycaniphila]OCA04235.1 hypothetical protein AC781_00665 [Akkermansia glycaniphila]SEH96840.1 rhs protein signature [Akkermansia glycaniphila]